MKKAIAICLVLLIIAAVVIYIVFFAEKDPGGKIDGGLILIENQEAKFNIVVTADAGSAGRRAAENFVTKLRSLGVEVADIISDTKTDSISDCEIIIGTYCRGRGDECSVTDVYLGKEGYTIKAVGNRIVIAGGTTELTRSALSIFIEKYLGITERTKRLEKASVPADLNEEVLGGYTISSLKIGGNDIGEYSIVCDMTDHSIYPGIVDLFQQSLRDRAGKWIDILDVKEAYGVDKQIIFRTIPRSADAMGKPTYADGFYVRCEGNNLIVESEYSNATEEAFDRFLEKYISNAEGEVLIPQDINYSDCVSIVKYSDFGALGNGEKDDSYAISAAHEYANISGQKVVADGDNYYMGMANSIPIKTDVDWGDAVFTVDDTLTGINIKKHIFVLTNDHAEIQVTATMLDSTGIPAEERTLKKGDLTVPWLAGILEAKSIVMIEHGSHIDYFRYGNNADTGRIRTDILIVNPDGTIDPSTPVTADFDKVGIIKATRVDDTPITVSGGFFKNICIRTNCKHTAAENCYKSKEKYCRSNVYNSVARGIRIERANATLMNIDHEILDEPDDGSAPYYGFLLFYNAHNTLVKNCNLTGHKTYVEYKTNAKNETNWVSMGTYDIVAEYSNNIRFEGVTQKRDIADSGYWGIMSSNGSKNLSFYDCEISRIDAHRGFWNMTVENCVIGHTFNVIGGGTLTVKNTHRIAGNSFVSLRGDYGATFDGDMIFENCYLEGIQAYNTVNGSASCRPTSKVSEGYIIKSGFSADSKYISWDFGFDCYMPHSVTITNFASGAGRTYVFNEIGDAAFPTYKITKSITYTRDYTVKITNKDTDPLKFLYGKSIATKCYSVAPGGSKLQNITPQNKKVETAS